MSNEFYTPTANPASNSSLSSSLIRAEFTALETSFGKLPTMAAKGGQMVIVNSGATALEATALLSVSGTTLVQNAATITISQNFVETRAVGATASGASTIHGRVTTLSGHADTTSAIGVYKFETDISGSNDLASASSVVPRVDYSGSGTLALVLLASGNLNHIGSGSITSSYGIGSIIYMQSTGGITTAGLFTARIPVFSSTGAITTLIGFDCQDVGHASLITNCHSFRAQDSVTPLTLCTAFKGEMTAGATKYNLYMSGTAANYLAGQLLIGHTASISDQASVARMVQVHTTSSPRGMSLGHWSNDGNAAGIRFEKSRGTTIGSYTAVVTGDVLGGISSTGSDGTQFASIDGAVSAQILFYASGTIGTNRVPGEIRFHTATDAASPVLTEGMRIDSAQNVIIGTAAIATTATDGFLRIPSCAGAPTGVPSSYAGRSPLIHDTTNNRIYLYDTVSAAWQYAALT